MSTRSIRSLAALGLALFCGSNAAPLGPPAPAAARAARAARAKVYLTVDQALELAFPDAVVTRGTAILSEAEKARATKLAGHEVESALAFPYIATRDGKTLGTAYFDNHRVRTLRETLMIIVDPAGRIARLEMLSFGEPTDYIPRDSWYAQFLKAKLDDELQLKRGIKGVTGATLTARATTDAARRVLALHQVLGERAPSGTSGVAGDTQGTAAH